MSRINLATKLGFALVLVSSLGIIGIVSDSSLKAQEDTNNTTIESIAEDTTNLIGQQVTVRGEVEEVEPGLSFTLREDGFLENDGVLVVNLSGEAIPEMPDQNLRLQVTGEVGKFVFEDVQEQYGLDLAPNVYMNYQDTPVIFASSIALSPTLEDISDQPENFYGQTVAVEGEVEEVMSDAVFAIQEEQLIGDENLLVINVSDELVPATEENVVIIGTIRSFVLSDLEQDYYINWDLDEQELEAEYSEQPVLIVDDMYVVPEN